MHVHHSLITISCKDGTNPRTLDLLVVSDSQLDIADQNNTVFAALYASLIVYAKNLAYNGERTLAAMFYRGFVLYTYHRET